FGYDLLAAKGGAVSFIKQTTAKSGVDVLPAGAPAKGEFRCAECGYGVAIHDALPRCPMCSGRLWEAAAWRPFTRASTPVGDPSERGPDAHLLL
ncbi:MAG: zinc ribbon-containing protein, partial [Actinomycetota bacterium]|nr:zinc ribbon-containing protein [Actinomycetota bacterium]